MANTTDPLARSIHGTNPQVWRTRERHSFGPFAFSCSILNQPLSHLENVIEIGYPVLTVPDSLISVHFRRASLLAESLGKDYEVENLRHSFLEGKVIIQNPALVYPALRFPVSFSQHDIVLSACPACAPRRKLILYPELIFAPNSLPSGAGKVLRCKCRGPR